MSPVQNLRLPVKGLPPLAEPLAGAAIEELLIEEDARRSEEHAANRHDNPALFVASDAYDCARKIAFRALRLPKDVEFDAHQLMTFRQGDWLGDVAERALIMKFGARTQVDFDWRPECNLYGRGDAAMDVDGAIAVEIKSISGYGFDVAVGSRKASELPGPKIEHCMQGGFLALSPQLKAQRVLIVLINKDRCTVAEWLMDVDEPLPHIEKEPTIRELVEKEVERLHGIEARLDAGEIPRRVVPGFGLVEDPPDYAARNGDPWRCRFCVYNDTCRSLPSDVIEGGVELVKKAKGVADAA